MAFKVHEKYEIEFENGHEYDDDIEDFIFFIEATLQEVPRTDFSLCMKYGCHSSTEMEMKYEDFNCQEGADKIFEDVFSKVFKWLENPNPSV